MTDVLTICPGALYHLSAELGRERTKAALLEMVPKGRSTPHRFLTLSARLGTHDRACEAVREHLRTHPDTTPPTAA